MGWGWMGLQTVISGLGFSLSLEVGSVGALKVLELRFLVLPEHRKGFVLHARQLPFVLFDRRDSAEKEAKGRIFKPHCYRSVFYMFVDSSVPSILLKKSVS